MAGFTPSSSKCCRLRGLLQRATTRATPYFSRATWEMRMLSSSSPVTATTQVGALDAGALEHPQLGAVAVLGAVLELLLDHRVAAQVGLDHRHLVTLVDQLAREVPAHLAGSHDQHVHAAGHPLEADLAAHGGLEQLDRGLGGADGLQALLGVPARPGRVQHAHHHALDVEAALGDLGDDEVGVVAVGGGDEGVGLLDPGREQRVDLERRALGEAPAALLPALAARRGRAARSPRRPRRGRRPRGPRRASTARSPSPRDRIRLSARTFGVHSSASRSRATPSRVPSSPAGGAVRITLQGAFSTT